MPMTANGIAGSASASRGREARVGERGELAADRDEVGEPEQVAQRDAEELASLRSAQHARCTVFAVACVAVTRSTSAARHGLRIARRRELGLVDHVEQRGLGDHRLGERARRARRG